MLATEWGVGQVFFSMIWFALFFIWIWLLISVFADVFRSKDLGGAAKALWVVFVIVLPFIGVFAYLIARGHKMGEHAIEQAEAQDAAAKSYIREVAGSSSIADEIEKLAALRDRGVISAAEFEAQKARLLAV